MRETYCFRCIYHYHLKLMLVLVLALTSTSASAWSFLAYRMTASIVVHRPHFQNAISLQPAGRSQLNFICSMSFVEDCLHMHSRKIASELWLQWQLIGPIDLLWEMLVNSVAPLFFVGSS